MTNIEIEKNFTYHKPDMHQVSMYEGIRENAKGFAFLLEKLCPESRERSLAMTKLEECVMWANASIARH